MNKYTIALLLLACCGGAQFSSIEATDSGTESGAESSVPDGADAPDSGGAESGPDAAGDASKDTAAEAMSEASVAETGSTDVLPDNWQTCYLATCGAGSPCCPGTFCLSTIEQCVYCHALPGNNDCTSNIDCCSGSCDTSTLQCN